MSFKKIDLSQLSFDPFTKIGKEWMLLTAGNKEKFNTMTASWGQMGVLWNKNVTASFFKEEYRKALSFCGAHSGRDCDKVKETGLTPTEMGSGMSFEEADMVFVCRKLYSYDLKEEGFLTDDGIPEQFFGPQPYHRAYIAEITAAYVKE